MHRFEPSGALHGILRVRNFTPGPTRTSSAARSRSRRRRSLLKAVDEVIATWASPTIS